MRLDPYSLTRRSLMGYLQAGILLVMVSACATPRGVPRRGDEPLLRVALVVDASEIRVLGQGRVAIDGASIQGARANEEILVSPSQDGVSIVGSTHSSRRIHISSVDEAQLISVDGRLYRGSIELIRGTEGVTAVNVVSTEDYLLGVVGVEMGRRNGRELAALEAQAIASRTYALKNRGRFRAAGFDLRAGVSDQAYLGYQRETELGNQAVRNTFGRIVTYEGRLISAFFHSTCGYSTAAPEESFRTVRSTPYLQPVSDSRPSGGYYCDISHRFRWTVEWDGDDLRDILRRTIPSVVGVDEAELNDLRQVRVHGVGPSRRVTEIRISVPGGEIPVFGPDLRRVFRTPEDQMLGSTAIEVATAVGNDRLESLTINGAGWGHGVGMCQWGAIGRARAGQNAREILLTYYPGTRIETMY